MRPNMSLEVLLQAAQFVDHPVSSGTGAAGTPVMGGRSAMEDVSARSSCQPTPSTSRSDTASGVYLDGFKGDCSRLSTDGYYQISGQCSQAQSESDAGSHSGYDVDLGEPFDTDQSGSGSRRQSSHRSSGSSRHTVPAEFWKNRGAGDKTKRVVMKHNTENRSVHNVLEKNRRAHLKDCFEALKQEVLDGDDEKKASHLAVLKSAVRCIQQLKKEGEKLLEDGDRLTKERASGQLRLQELKREILSRSPNFDVAGCLRENHDDADSQMTCTAPGSPPPGRYSESPQRPLLQIRRSTTPHYESNRLPSNPSPMPSSRYAPSPQQPQNLEIRRSTTPNTSCGPERTALAPPNILSPETLCPPEIHLSPPPRSRKKGSGTADRSAVEGKHRKPAVKISVAKIVHESKTSSPIQAAPLSASLSSPSSASSVHVPLSATTTASEPASSEPRRHLPIKLRILQDQQEGMFLDSNNDSPVDMTIPQTPQDNQEDDSPQTSNHQKPSWEIPVPAIFNQGGFWTTDGSSFAQMPAFYAPQNGFSATPMYQMNQFLVPISTMNGMSGAGVLGQMPPGLIMLPTNGAHGGAVFQYGQLPSIHQLPTLPKRPPS